MTQREKESDEMREEYDFSHSVRAPYAALAGDVQVVALDEDVRAVFPDSQSVNDALRVLIKAAKGVKDLPKAS